MQSPKDLGYRNLRVYQPARTLAAIAHTITFSKPGFPSHVAFSLRRTSRLLLNTIIEAYRKGVSGKKDAQAPARVSAAASEILALIQSPDSFPEGSEIDRSSLLTACQDILAAIQGNGFQTTEYSVDQKAETVSPSDEGSGLEGRVVLITRASAQSQTLAEGIGLQEGLPVIIPMIEITDPESWEEVDKAIINLPGYDGVVFTSRNAVDPFRRRIDVVSKSARSVLASRPVAAVGEKTRNALEKGGIPVILTPELHSSAGLGAALRQDSVRGKRYLFPKGDLARGDLVRSLRDGDAVVDEVVVYKTVKPDSGRLDPLREALQNKEIDAVTFLSPSSVDNFVESVGRQFPSGFVAACIGPSTAAEAKAAGLPVVIVAKETSTESVVGALVDYYESLRPPSSAKGPSNGE